MSRLLIQFEAGSVHLPELGLWLDPHEPLIGPELAFVSHAHSDHIAAHREVLLSAPTSKLMQARVPGIRQEHIFNFGETKSFGFNETEFQITLIPAGHIFGSAMALLHANGQSLLYTGDFKLRRGLSAEPCEPRPADILIMETTYGRPQYVFPPSEEVLKGIIRFCHEAIDNDETPVLLGYSLGKSQELLCGLGSAGLPLMLHGTVHRLTRIYEQFGQCFPKYERYEAGSALGKVLVCPPNVTNSAMLRNLGKVRTAILTGWAVDSNCRYRYRCDAAFPLSDHADFPDLVEFVKQVRPKKVYTLHGFAADFAQHLRQLGFEANSLSQNEQFALALNVRALPRQTVVSKDSVPKPTGAIASAGSSSLHGSSPDLFVDFARVSDQIAANPGKLEKIRLLAEYLQSLQPANVSFAATWFSGRPLPATQNKVLQLGWAILRDSLCSVTGADQDKFNQVYLKHSDLGETANELMQSHVPEPSLQLQEIDELFQKLHAVRGPLAKTPLLIHALQRATALEAKYLVKIITGDLRIGLKEGLVEEAIAKAFVRPADEVRQANLVLGDIGETASLAKQNKLKEASLQPFRPVKFMLASPEETSTDILNRVQEWNSSPASEPGAFSVWLEDKYDGIRCQLHKVGNRVALFSRDLKEITGTFLELTDSMREIPIDCILDGEIVAMRGDEVLPFADLQRRLGRKEADLFMREEVPIKFVCFDLLWSDGQTCLNWPLQERRRTLESLTPMPGCFQLARISQVHSVEEIETAFSAARDRGNEGLMIKDPRSTYTPGRRGLAWLKLKKAFATLDCVVIGAEYGHGKRSKVLSDYTFAVRDEKSGDLKTIGKAYTGLTDLEIYQLTEHFLKTAIRQHGRYFEVIPDTILEIAFDKIQPSTRHDSGLALRFPRILRIRTDKPLTEIDTLENARKLANATTSSKIPQAK